jgi:hypothetical protein
MKRTTILKLSTVLLVVGACQNGSGGSASITINPNSFTCLQDYGHVVTIKLPASVQASDQLSIGGDGNQVFDTMTVSEWGFTVQSDGSWLLTATDNSPNAATRNLAYADECAFAISGQHTLKVIVNGSVVAQTTYRTP